MNKFNLLIYIVYIFKKLQQILNGYYGLINGLSGFCHRISKKSVIRFNSKRQIYHTIIFPIVLSTNSKLIALKIRDV